jgi:hypothetical protein
MLDIILIFICQTQSHFPVVFPGGQFFNGQPLAFQFRPANQQGRDEFTELFDVDGFNRQVGALDGLSGLSGGTANTESIIAGGDGKLLGKLVNDISIIELAGLAFFLLIGTAAAVRAPESDQQFLGFVVICFD